MKKIKFSGWLSVLLAFVCVLTSCDGKVNENMLMTKSLAAIDTDRDNTHGYLIVDGIKTASVELGNVWFWIAPNDTTVVDEINLAHTKLDKAKAVVRDSINVEDNGVKARVYTYRQTFEDKYNLYLKQGYIEWKEAVFFYKEKVYWVTPASAAIDWVSVKTATIGREKSLAYTLCTSDYKLSFLGKELRHEQGLKTLATESTNVLVSVEKTGENFEVLTYDSNNNPKTARSTIFVVSHWSNSDPHRDTLSVILNVASKSPARDEKEVASFDAVKTKTHVVGSAEKYGDRSDGMFDIERYRQLHTLKNTIFDKVVTMEYEKAYVTYCGQRFEMPYRIFQSITDAGATMTNMSAANGFDRKLYAHTATATYAGKPVKNVCETVLKVKQATPTIVDEGLDWVDGNTTKSWIKIKTGDKTETKSINLKNKIMAPSKVTKIISSWSITKKAAVKGSKKLTNTTTEGDFTVKTYQTPYTVGNNFFTLEFTLQHQEAVYNPMSHTMRHAEYNITSDSFTTSALSDVQNSGKTYERKSYTHSISGTFLEHAVSSSAQAELWVEKQGEERETPHWLGAPVSALYSRVPDPTYYLDNNTNAKFQDMIVFEYEHGLVVCPEGKVKKTTNGQLDSHFIFAFDATTASKYGVKQCIHASWSNTNAQKKYSAAYYDSRTYPSPATIQIKNGIWSWVGRGWTEPISVDPHHANVMEIGVEVTPVPTTQSYSIDGNKITIRYCKNNDHKDQTDTSLDLR